MKQLWGRLNRKYLVRYRLEYLGLLGVYYLICAAGPEMCWACARLMGRFVWRLGIRRTTVMTNLGIAFPEKSEAERAEIGRRSFEHVAVMVVDILLQRRLVSRANFDRRITVTGWAQRYLEEHGEAALRQRARGIVFITGHFGNWEMSSGIFSILGVHIAPVYRMPQNPFIAKFLNRIRLDRHTKFIERRGAVNEMLRHLDSGGNVGFLFDQEALYGMPIDFFGKPASTHKTPAVLARDHDSPIFFGVTIRTGDMTYEGRGELVDFPPKTEDRAADHRAYMQVLSDMLEAVVREYPEQYLWAHRRWKRTGAHAAYEGDRKMRML